MPKDKIDLFKLDYRLSQLEEKLRFYEEKLQVLELFDIEIQREQVKKHLNYLNYKVKDGNKIYLNCSYHPTDFRYKDDKLIKFSTFNWEKIEKQQSKGRNIYVVVNGYKGGHDEEDTKKFVGIFCEWNNIKLGEQQHRWQEIDFVAPTFSVSQGESMQSYWIFNEPLKDKEQWQKLQENLVKAMKIEPYLVSSSQSLVLAGSWYIKPNQNITLVEICQESGQKYNIDELQKIC